ncbi:MAG: DUF3598 family protein [Pelatocladus maniniholoensis HA4357-MV3]|jgi:hypothetical protein|uniref:DUF3598 family protein n=1 Tax=Pelatocladus maniniholoensis HA4357-MV3 TaxID=1117104 RepID=A0A9E3HDT0_9NOST|nr:DUF3598 family protein [Pelatocladus maniniholoensis HA4357-MV3]BAZ67834.1 hypothetical protein NIES4106_25910 [Fischerella sp. NIES-4106]
MSIIKAEMPLMARHEGEWSGSYTLVDNEGKILDKYTSHLSCQFREDETSPYYQINRYQWPSGKQEEHHFPGRYENKNVWFDTERLTGQAWEVDNTTMIFLFTFKNIPGQYLYETIFLSPCNNYRFRTWHWFKNHQVYQRTLVQEERMR